MTSPEVLVSWTGDRVKAETVAAQMLELRHGAADEEGYPLARASVMNLIVFAAEAGLVQEAVRIVDELAVRHPARSIVADLTEAHAFALDAEVTLRRHPLAAHGLVYERAVLHARGADPEGLDTLVIPVLIPHLQSFLWWLGDPNTDDPALRSLGAICDRLVVDSSLGPAHRLRDLSAMVGGGGTGAATSPTFARLVLGDVAWSRLDGFRRTLVQIFDEGYRAEYLEGVTRVEIRGQRGSKSPVSSAEVLVAGWLASRLGWSQPAWAAGGVSMRQESRRAHLLFTGVRGGRSGTGGPAVLGLQLDAEIGRRKLSVDMSASRTEARVVITESGAGTTTRTFPMPQMSETEALSRELARIGRDRVYEDAILSSARILSAFDS